MAVLTIVFMWKYIFHWNEENVLCSNYTAKSYSLILVESVSEQIRMYQILSCAEQRIQIEYLLINREYAMIQIVGHSLFRWWLPGGLQSLGKYLSLSQNWIDQHQSCKNSHIGTAKSKSQTAKQHWLGWLQVSKFNQKIFFSFGAVDLHGKSSSVEPAITVNHLLKICMTLKLDLNYKFSESKVTSQK